MIYTFCRFFLISK